MDMHTDSILRSNLDEFLGGVDFPADKTDLISYALQMEIDQNVMDILEQLPDQEFGSASEVMDALGESA